MSRRWLGHWDALRRRWRWFAFVECTGMEPGQFRKDIDEITKRFQLRPHSFLQAVRLGQAIFHMSHPESTGTGTLMAARDLKNDLDAKRHGGAS